LRSSRICTIIFVLLTAGSQSGCAVFGPKDTPRSGPISNPFASYRPTPSDSPPMILRSKKGDRSVEIQIPGDTQELSEFVLPVSPDFKSDPKHNSSTAEQVSSTNSESFENHAATPSDHEITQGFSKGSLEDQEKRRDIEQSLNLTPSDDDTPQKNAPSYLASMDQIKQLYRNNRYEAALLQTDDMIKMYQTDPRLYEMRGTLLDRLGRRELAIKSWTQALKLDPGNGSLRKFLDQKQVSSTVGSR